MSREVHGLCRRKALGQRDAARGLAGAEYLLFLRALSRSVAFSAVLIR